MAKQLLGKEVASALCAQLRDQTTKLVQAGIVPTLAVVRVGENPSDLSYERGVTKRAGDVGVQIRNVVLPEQTDHETLAAQITVLNRDDTVHGILLFRPLPKHLKSWEQELAAMVEPSKDVDGMTDRSNAGVYMAKPMGFAPCTPEACMEILDYYGIDCTGKRAVVVGRSLVVGKPLAMMLLSKHATVTVCHTRTTDLAAECQRAEILVAAAGKASMLDARHVRPGAIVLDVGINWSEEKQRITGDVNYEAAEPMAAAITPVPGGVGAVTTPILLRHVVQAAQAKKPEK